MKKQQKIIELRTAAKLKVAEIEAEIAFAHGDAAGKRARLMWERASELDGLEAGSTERLDVLAKYRAKLADENAQLASKVAQLKSEIQQVKAECEKQCAAAEDDPETMRELPQQTVYCDGSEHSARIVARRMINKMPHIQKGGSLNVHVLCGDDGDFFVSVSELGNCEDDYISSQFTRFCGEKEEAEFVEKARRLFAEEKPDSGNSHVAEPMASALDAVFGGNPFDYFPTLKKKEGENE